MRRNSPSLTLAEVIANNIKVGAKRGGILPDPVVLGPPVVKPKRPKYGNVPVIVDGIRMPSKREAKRYRELRLLFKSSEIDFLARQVSFWLPGGIEYVADFVYGETIGQKTSLGRPFNLTVEDAKGFRTKEFIIKKKLMKAEYGIEVIEV